MECSTILSRFVKQAPLSVMTRVTLEHFFGATRVNNIFEEVSQNQHTRKLAFSTVVDLLVEVSLFGCESVNAAYLRDQERIPVSVVAVYEKLQGVEPAVCEALVRRTADSAVNLITALQAQRPEPIRGYRLRIGDANVLGRSERRLGLLRGTNVAALPGQSVVLFDYATGVISQIVPCENAHTSEKKVMLGLLPHLQEGDLFMGDSCYSSFEFLQGVRERKASFLVRHHGSQKLQPLSKRRRAGTCRTGTIWEQKVQCSDGHAYRAIIIQRHKPLKNGKRKLILLTNVPTKKASAKKLALLYMKRWTIEEAFRQLTQYLSCEVKTLGYPKAALLAFSLAVLAYNCLACVKAALAKSQSWEKVDAELSDYRVAREVKRTYEGMCIAVPAKDWKCYAKMSLQELTGVLNEIATTITWSRYKKTPRGPKKSYRKTRQRCMHVATANLLETASKAKN
jgi:hypothetical protein